MIHDLTVFISTAGLGRTPLTILGYLTTIERLDPKVTVRLILADRPGVLPPLESLP